MKVAVGGGGSVRVRVQRMSGVPDEATARKLWELENNIQVMEMDEIFKVDEEKHMEMLEKRPWLSEFV